MLKKVRLFLVSFLILTLTVAFVGCGKKTTTAPPDDNPDDTPNPNLLFEEKFATNTADFFGTYNQNWELNNANAGDIDDSVSEGVLWLKSSASKTPHIVYLTAPTTNKYTMTVYVKIANDASAGLLSHWTDKNNFYVLRIRKGELSLGNSKIGGTTASGVDSSVQWNPKLPETFDATVWHKLTMTVLTEPDGVTIKGYVDDVEYMNQKLTGDLALQAGKVGLYATIDGSKGNEAWFKDFSCSKIE